MDTPIIIVLIYMGQSIRIQRVKVVFQSVLYISDSSCQTEFTRPLQESTEVPQYFFTFSTSYVLADY